VDREQPELVDVLMELVRKLEKLTEEVNELGEEIYALVAALGLSPRSPRPKPSPVRIDPTFVEKWERAWRAAIAKPAAEKWKPTAVPAKWSATTAVEEV